MRHPFNRRSFLVGSAALCAGGLAHAAWSPDRPIELLVSFAPGGTADALARLVAQKLQEKRKWVVVVVNRPGAAGVVMQRALKITKPDGYTVGFCGSHDLTYPPTSPAEMPYSVKDFRFIASVADLPHCLVGRPKDKLETLPALRAHAKSRGSLSVGFSQPYEGAVKRLGDELGLPVVPVPFKGGAEMMQHIVAGNLDLGWSGGSHVGLEQAGQLKTYLALTPYRLPDYPQTPTAREFGSSVAVESRFVLLGASALQPEVAAEWDKALDEVLADPSTRAAILSRNLVFNPKTGKQLDAALSEEAAAARAILR